MTVLLDRMFIFAYKACGCFNGFEKHCSTDIENTDLMKMLKSLSHYPCAAKSLVGVNTNAKRPMRVNQKRLENLMKTTDFR